MSSGDTTEARGAEPLPLPRALGGFQYFTIALGCMISISWIAVLGEWLGRAGTLGAVLGFLAGGLVMAGIASCYAELTGVVPLSGGDVVFADRVFGRNAAFFVGWFLVLAVISVAGFGALSFVWVAQTLWPSLGGRPLYRILDKPVGAADIVLGAIVVLSMHLCNRSGIGTSARVQDALTALKLIVMTAFIAAAVVTGSPRLTQNGTSLPEHWFAGMLRVAGTSAFWLGGFQVISQAAEERSPSTTLGVVGRVIVGSVGISVLVYIGLVLVASMAVPREALLFASLPAAAAAPAVFHSRWGAFAMLGAGLCGILATLNAMMIARQRLLFALARIGYLPALAPCFTPRLLKMRAKVRRLEGPGSLLRAG
jgi:basic amino acid/polyamine antiporter, APA family